MSITITDTEFIKIVEAAADFDDYRCGTYFERSRKSESTRWELSAVTAESLAQTLPGPQSARMHLSKSVDGSTMGDLFSRGTDSPLRLRNPAMLPPWACELREMFDGLATHDFATNRTPPLHRLCECGSRYGFQRLQTKISSELRNYISAKAKERLNIDLRRMLAHTTRPCFALGLEASRLAYQALRSNAQEIDRKSAEITRLRGVPSEQLCFMFKMFPVLGRLWSQLISQWCKHINELLLRFTADRRALSHAFFSGERIDKIIDLRAGLSDPHNEGRTAVLLQFESGSVIYKPRGGDGEWEWLHLLRWMNSQSFRPKLRAARVLRREGYCWMEQIQPKPCKDQDAARRFYGRVGGMLAATYLLRAVDCHRDNMIASREYPILIDIETLWHVEREKKTKSLLEPLYGTGFLPSSGRRSSFQYQSSALGRTNPGEHTPHIAAKPLSAERYEIEISNGFRRAWRCLLGTTARRAAFGRHAQRIRRRKRRWIYRSTRDYDAIRRASIQPAALRTGIERDLLIARSCARSAVPQAVIREEINALKRLDIPYFTRKTRAAPPPPQDQEAPTEIVEALRRAVHL
jgi:lantibiotic modifying enzyme